MSDDMRWMGAALTLAERGRGRTAPNPPVGCVIVKDDRVVGRGWTQPGGRPHAEAVALAQADNAAKGATAYVTLEPCAHESARGPACSNLLIEACVARVVIAMLDPDSRTNGKGTALLNRAGVKTSIGIRADDAVRTMTGFLTRQREGRPNVTLKLATSLDGKIALRDGTSRWITGAVARAHAHLERARHEIIVVGRGTYDVDKPALDVRLAGLEDRSPRRAVITRSAAPDGWERLESPASIASIVDADHVLVEGGAMAAASFLKADLVDRLLLYRAPILIGSGRDSLGDIGLGNLNDAHGRWRAIDSRQLGSDRLDVYERVRG